MTTTNISEETVVSYVLDQAPCGEFKSISYFVTDTFEEHYLRDSTNNTDVNKPYNFKQVRGLAEARPLIPPIKIDDANEVLMLSPGGELVVVPKCTTPECMGELPSTGIHINDLSINDLV